MYYKSLRVFVKENISGRYRIAQILDEGFLLLFTVASYGCIEQMNRDIPCKFTSFL